MELITTFQKKYNADPMRVFCPYRICPLGAHIDHQHGKITGLAIDKGVHLAYLPTDDTSVELTSLQFTSTEKFDLQAIPEKKCDDWADYMRGASIFLAEKYELNRGLRGVFDGDLPIGGLSSSAAVTIAFISALCRVNGIELTESEAISTAIATENHYVGVSSGKLDQSCEVLCRKDHLLYLDTADDSYEIIPQSASMKPYKIAIFFSGLERVLVGSKYNLRVDECKSSAYALMAHSGMDYGKFADTYLRDVPRSVYDEYGSKLPEFWRRRAEHFYTESARVEEGVTAWRNGDIEKFGRLVFESGRSSIEKYEAGSDELKAMYEIMLTTDGIYGGRFSGAGFKGCCMALIDPSFEDRILERVEREYLRRFPQLEGKYTACICSSADGINLK